MKYAFFVLYILGLIYAATRWEFMSYVLIGLSLFGAAFVLYKAAANYLCRHDYF